MDALKEANVTSVGAADSFIKASHVVRTRCAHQVTAGSLFIRLVKEYAQAQEVPLDLDNWFKMRCSGSPQFQYWLELELKFLLLMQFLCERDF